MNNVLKAIAAIAIASSIAAPAAAMVDRGGLNRDVLSAVGAGGQVHVVIENDTVVLNGYVQDAYASFAAERAAGKAAGVNKVVNNLFETD